MNRGGRVSVADVARWINKSKPTAQEWLLKLVNQGWLKVEIVAWRKNANKLLFYPMQDTIINYSQNRYKSYYDMYIRDLAKSMEKVKQEILI